MAVRVASPVAARNLAASPGVTLVQGCTPTGPELCFNAVDDNCNGVIDEGCGVQTGLMQFTIAWSSDADVNLAVSVPGEEKALDDKNRATKGGFHLDRDCPEEGCHGQNEENVSFDGREAPPPGHYVVSVVIKALRGTAPPVKVRFGARLGTRVV